MIFDEISKLTSFTPSMEYLRFNVICVRSQLSCHSSHLLGRDLVCRGPHVDLLVGVDTGNDEEHARPPGSPGQQPAQPEDDCPLVLLDHLDGVEEREGERGHDQNERDDGQQEAAQPGALLARWKVLRAVK